MKDEARYGHCRLQGTRDVWLLMQPSPGVVCNNGDHFFAI
jgi:hypothetical protein